MRVLCTVILASLLLAPPAHAADVLRVGLGTSLQEFVAGPDGVWVSTYASGRSRVVRVTPEGVVRATPVKWVSGGALGPDGQAWFEGSPGILRFDARGAMSALRVDRVTSGIATGPDGTAWLGGPEPVRLAPDGTDTPLTLTAPDCPESPRGFLLASDGAMWFDACGLWRLPLAGDPARVADEVPGGRRVADQRGGFWFAYRSAPGGGHVDASGRVTPLHGAGRRGTEDVAVAPDGSAWFATGRCHLLRAEPDGTVRRHAIAIPASRLAFDPAGGLWLASAKRVRYTTLAAPAGRCDDTPPRARVVPDPSKPVSAAALRRHGGFKITVREPFWTESMIFDVDGDETLADVLTTHAAGTVRIRLSDDEIRDFVRRKGTPLSLTGEVRDAEGNSGGFEYELRLRP